MSHANISVFVPHLGCPIKCSFCDQHIITGETKIPQKEDIENAVTIAKNSKNYNGNDTELAFFGGSFTAINRQYMLELLEIAFEYVKHGDIKGIRISTRPDCIDFEVLQILKTYGVTAIELGAQSMCDDVLTANKRGHRAEAVYSASKIIKEFGFELGLQMMTGLYRSNREKDLYTAKEIVALTPNTVRIYPTVTLEGTYLAELYKENEYNPPSLDETVDICVELLEMFQTNGINVIRMGLHTIDTKRYVAGPWHPSFRELCDSRVFLNKILEMLPEEGEYTLFVNSKDVSKVMGNKKANITKLSELGFKVNVKTDDNLPLSELTFERMNNSCI